MTLSREEKRAAAKANDDIMRIMGKDFCDLIGVKYPKRKAKKTAAKKVKKKSRQ
jgi:hypothetical protein